MSPCSKNIPKNNEFNYIHWKLAFYGLVNKPILPLKVSMVKCCKVISLQRIKINGKKIKIKVSMVK